MSNLIAKKLEFLIARANLTAPQFAADFAKTTGVRKAVVEEWLADRKIYEKNLEKLVSYWRKLFPTITQSHFLLPQEAFERSFSTPAGRQMDATGPSLTLPINPLSGTQINALTGAYRLYWYGLSARPALVGETLCIYPDSNETLRAELRSPLAKGVQTFVGPVIAMGDRTYLLLSDIDTSSSAMRFVTLQGHIDKKGRNHVLGIMSGAFDKNDTIASVTVAVEKQPGNFAQAREETSWLAPVALDKVPPEILLDLTQTKLSGTS